MLILDFNDGRGKVKANIKTARGVHLRNTRQLSKIRPLNSAVMTALIGSRYALFLLAYACMATLTSLVAPLGKRGSGGAEKAIFSFNCPRLGLRFHFWNRIRRKFRLARQFNSVNGLPASRSVGNDIHQRNDRLVGLI